MEADDLSTPRRRSDLVLCLACIGLATACWIWIAIWLNQWTDEHNAALAQACDVCEDTYGDVVPAVAGFFQGVYVVFGLGAAGWLLGRPHWYWRVPLLLTSVVVTISGIVFWPGFFVGALGFVTSVRPSALFDIIVETDTEQPSTLWRKQADSVSVSNESTKILGRNVAEATACYQHQPDGQRAEAEHAHIEGRG
jgi:hypothetical protein